MRIERIGAEPKKKNPREEEFVCMACGRSHTGICSAMHKAITEEPPQAEPQELGL
jgi:hypothetical protein